jgi:hypothetical protein|tara:strand:+ start:1175 stop:2224 length:1050 start_codon:yes stop_codon:yes gene_type:complete
MRLSLAKQIIVKGIEKNLAQKANQKPITFHLEGSMGIGKTALAKEIAKDINFYLQNISLAQLDPTDVGGMRMPSGDKMKVLQPDWYVDAERMSKLKAEGYKGVLYFFDELPQSPILNMNIFAQIADEYRIGEYILDRSECYVMSAGNKLSDKAGTNQMPMHLVDRLTFLEIEANLDDTLSYFSRSGVDFRINSWLRFQPEFLHMFKAGVNAYPTPRSIERSAQIMNWGLDAEAMAEAISGQIGRSAYANLKTHMDIHDKCPDVDQLIANPDTAQLVEEPAIMYALCSSLSMKANVKNIGNILKYLQRLPNEEFQAYVLKDALARDNSLKQSKDVRLWASAKGNGKYLVA